MAPACPSLTPSLRCLPGALTHHCLCKPLVYVGVDLGGAETLSVWAVSVPIPSFSPTHPPTLQALPWRPQHASLQAVIASIQALTTRRRLWRRERTHALGALSVGRTARRPLYGRDLVEAVRVEQPAAQVHLIAGQRGRHLDFCDALRWDRGLVMFTSVLSTSYFVLQLLVAQIVGQGAAPGLLGRTKVGL